MRTRQHAIVAYVMAILGALAVSVLPASAAQDPPPAAAGGRVRPDARQGQARPGQQADRLEIAELQRLFDAYTVMQAQDALQLDDAQFGQFLPKLKALQDTRRRNEIARSQAVAELARMTAPGAAGFDEAAVKEKMRALVEEQGGTIGSIYYCPHHPQGSSPEYGVGTVSFVTGTVAVTLLDLSSKESAELVVFQNTYRLESPIPEKGGAGFAAGMSRAMSQFSRQVISDIGSALRGR